MGFLSGGSMHELFLKMMTGGKDTVSVNARFPNLIKSYRFTLDTLVFSHRTRTSLVTLLNTHLLKKKRVIATNLRRQL